MELSQLRAFLAAAQYENMTRAAESLHVTQPALLAREVDLALTGPSVQSEEIAWQRLCTEPMGIILSRGHPLAALGELSVAQLRGQRFYCNNSNSDFYDLARYFCAQAGFEPDVCYEGDFPQFISEAISRGLGVSFIAPGRFAGGAEQAWETDIVFRPLKDAFCVRESGIAAPRGCYRTKAVRAFCDCLQVRRLTFHADVIV